ncbi:hypothetical protein GCM10027026_12670 [Myroides odoratimimus subsp. xuanwuensis]
MAWGTTVWTAMRVPPIVPDLRDSRRSAGVRHVPGDARGPAWWLALLGCKPLLLLGRRADWRRTERLPGSGGAVLGCRRRRVTLLVGDPVPLGDLRELPRATAVTVGVQRLQDTLAAMVDQLADEHAR